MIKYCLLKARVKIKDALATPLMGGEQTKLFFVRCVSKTFSGLCFLPGVL